MRKVVSVFGLGYVGLTTAACFATRGLDVIGFDIDSSKVQLANEARASFNEPFLDEILQEVALKGNLRCTSDAGQAVSDSDITFVAVGTPSKLDGSIDLTFVENASEMIGRALCKRKKWHLVVIKSTVTPGTTMEKVKPIIEESSGKKCKIDFGLCMNPEFLREGSAVEDTFHPDRLVIGQADQESGDALEKLFRVVYPNKTIPLIRTTPENAELIKYANNAFLAMKVSFINSIARICQRLPKADVEAVAEGIGLDKRIGPQFLRAGAGWGGSCWPKDLKAFKSYADQQNLDLPLIEATMAINDLQPYVAVHLARELVGDLRNRRISVLGLSFKPDTDDMREAVSVRIVRTLEDMGAKVVVYDPLAMSMARQIFKDKVQYASGIEDCLKGSECALVVTEWGIFRELAPEDFIRLMKIPAVVDARRIYDAKLYSSKMRFAAIGLGSENYSSPAVAVNAIVEDNNRILLVRRQIDPFKNMWSLPGGFVEHDETAEDALVREVEEESGLRIKVKHILNSYSDPLRSPEKRVIAICYVAYVIRGSLRPSNESSEVRFFTRQQLPSELAFDHLDMVKTFLNTNQ